MARSATDKLADKKQPKKVVLEKDFAGIRAGQRMLVGTPRMIDDYIRRVPFGETRSIPRLRNELARRHRCDATCPVSTAIFLRIAAEASLEALERGENLAEVSPFWRVIAPNDKIASRLPIDSDWIERQRVAEQ